MLSRSLIFLAGFVFFSSVVSFLQLNILRLPLFVFEPVVIAMAVVLARREGVRVLSALSPAEFLFSYFFIILISVLVFIAVAGPSTSSLVDAVSSARPFMFALVGSICYRLVNGESLLNLSYFFGGIVLGDFAIALIAPDNGSANDGISAMNVLAVFCLSFILARFHRVVVMLLGLFFLLIVIFNSGFRINILAASVGTFSGLTGKLLYNRSPKAVLQFVGLSVLSLFVASTTFDAFKEHGREWVDPFVYFRIVNRISAYFEGDIEGAQDDERLRLVLGHLSDNLPILPLGFTMRADGKVGEFNDFPMLYFWNNFGFALGSLLFIALLFLGLRHFFNVIWYRTPSVAASLSAWFLPFFMVLVLLNGRFLYIAQEAFIFGLLIGPWVFPNGLTRMKYSKAKRYRRLARDA